MKKVITLSFLLLLSLGCSKDDDEIPVDNSLFLQKSIPQFTGKINDVQKNWEFGFNTYQMNTASLYIDGASNPNRFLRFVLNAENGNNQFILSCPVYDTSSELEFNQVFGLGVKDLGESGTKFHIEITNDDYTYRLCNPNSTYKIEVLKKEETTEINHNELKVWFKIKKVKSENCTTGNPFIMENILIIAKFIDYKNF